MKLHNEIVEKLLQEVDEDIRELMLKPNRNTEYKGYHLLPDPTNTILSWQYMRDYKGK